MSQYSLAIWDKLPDITDLPKKGSTIPTKYRIDAHTREILLPTLKHLRPIEAKRAMLIMDNIITQVLLVGALPNLMASLELYNLIMDRETTDLIEELTPIAAELEEITHGKRTSSVDSIYRDSMAMQRYSHLKKDIKLSKQIFDGTRKLLRKLMQNKSATVAFLHHYRQWKTQPSEEIAELAKVLVQMRHLLREALLTTTKDRSRRDHYQYRAERKNLKNDRIIAELTETLDRMTRQHNEFIARAINEITFINHEIIQLEQDTATGISEMRDHFIEGFILRKEQLHEQMEILTEDNEEARRKLKETQQDNRVQEKLLMRKKWAIEDEVLGLLKSKDDKLFDLKAEVDKIEEQLFILKMQSDDLLVKFEPIKAEYDEVMEVYRLKAEEEKKEREEKEEMIKSATYIQSMYRAWKARKAMRKRKSKR